MNNLLKVLTFLGFRTMANWLAYQTDQFIQRTNAQIAMRFVGSYDNWREIYDAFCTVWKITVGSTVYTYDHQVTENSPAHPFAWTSDGGSTFVYTDSRNPAEGDDVYDTASAATATSTVSAVTFPSVVTVEQQWPGDSAVTQHECVDTVCYMGGSL